jgi:hypothetical protein
MGSFLLNSNPDVPLCFFDSAFAGAAAAAASPEPGANATKSRIANA